MTRLGLCIVSAAVAVLLPSTALHAASGTSIMLGGRVPTVCNVDIDQNLSLNFHAGTNRLGQMTELCNNVAGYRLVLQHPRGLQDAFIMLDGQRIPIAASATETVIVDSSHPAFRHRALALILAQAIDADLPLNLYAEAKGPIF